MDDSKLKDNRKGIPLDGMKRFLLKEGASLHTSNYWESAHGDVESSHSEQQEIPSKRL